MKYSINLSKDNFDIVDFSEADIIDFNCCRELTDSLSFTVWGATLLTSAWWNHAERFKIAFPDTDDIYVAGIGTIRIDKLVGGSLKVYLRDTVSDDGNWTHNIKRPDGADIINRREWKCNISDVDEYLWECNIAWPYGGCVLELFSDGGNITYEFDSDDMIPASDYVKNALFYCYDEYNLCEKKRNKR